MPTYLSPGVFVEEVPAGTQPIEGVGTSTGAFVGLAERGPTDTARLITNYTQFVNEFGRHITDSFLAYSVFSFFAEGGTRCYVVRVAGATAAASTVTLSGGDTNPALQIDADSVGTWGDRVSYNIDAPTNEDPTTHFKLTVRYLDQVGGRDNLVVELYDDVSMDDIEERINGVSSYISVTYLPLATGEDARTLADKRPADSVDATTFTALSGGADDNAGNFIGTEAAKSGLYAFDVIDDINIVAIPDLAKLDDENSMRNRTIDALVYCENRADCFFIADTPLGVEPSAVREYKQGGGATYTGNALNSTYGALYYPWIKISNPLANGRPIDVPPSGVIAGSFANTDSTRGVFKAPAGTVDGFLNSALGIERQVTKGEQDVLNPLGVNVIRQFPAAGIVIWGARTLSNIAEWRYVNVRRLMLFIEESIDEGSQFVVFEPNDPTLWGKVRRTLTAFLTRVWRDGALFGNSPEEAFFVKVDEENNPPAVRDAGQLIIEVGVAPVKPAEFVVIRIAQQTQATN